MDTSTLRARDVMTADPCVVDGELTLADAADRMRINNLHHLLVVYGEELVGVLRTSDVNLAIALAREGDSAPIRLAVMRNIPRCDADDPLSSVVVVLQESITGCAVVYERGDLVGVVTNTDLVHMLREILAGETVEQPHPATHGRDPPSARPAVAHGVRTSDIVRSHGAGPGRGPRQT